MSIAPELTARNAINPGFALPRDAGRRPALRDDASPPGVGVASRGCHPSRRRYDVRGAEHRALPVPRGSIECLVVLLTVPFFNGLQCYTVPPQNGANSPIPERFVPPSRRSKRPLP